MPDRITMQSRLSAQQRGLLAEAAKHTWISPSMFEGVSKNYSDGNYSRGPMTTNSAYKALKRLEARGLLGRYHEHNPVLFAITEAGKRAISDEF
jgi:hypothetical protein